MCCSSWRCGTCEAAHARPGRLADGWGRALRDRARGRDRTAGRVHGERPRRRHRDAPVDRLGVPGTPRAGGRRGRRGPGLGRTLAGARRRSRRRAASRGRRFLVNVTGALLIGVLMVVVTDVVTGRPLLRPFLGVGLLGGWTTFSTYALEARDLLAAGSRRARRDVRGGQPGRRPAGDLGRARRDPTAAAGRWRHDAAAGRARRGRRGARCATSPTGG